MFVIDDIAASLAVDLIIKLGKRGLKKSDQKKYEHLLKAAIYKSISEFEKNNKIDGKEGKYPFYQSQIFMNAFLSFSFFKDIDQSSILNAIQKDNRVIPPTEEQINLFLELFKKHINEKPELLNIEIDNKYKGEIFSISQKVDSVKVLTEEVLEILKGGIPSGEFPKFLTPPHLVEEQEVIGREKNIEEITKYLNESNKVLLVNGLGGIGKTTVAKLYLVINKEKYDHIAWVDCSVSLSDGLTKSVDLIENLKLLKSEETDEITLSVQILNKLRNISGINLLVIDNAKENLIKDSDNLPAKPNWHVLVTSRQNLHPFKEYPLDTLSPQKAKELFKLHYRRDVVEDDLDELLKLIHYHTLSIELLAKTLASGSHLKGIKELAEYLETHKLDTEALKVNIRMGDDPEYVQVYSYLLNAFDISNLNEEEVWMLKQFSILPSEEINPKLLLQLLNTDEEKKPVYINHLNSLYDKGWLGRNDNKTYKAHQIIQEIIKYKTHPTIDECAAIIASVSKELNLDQIKDNPIDKFEWITFGESVLESFNNETNELSLLQNNLGIIYMERGNFDDAREQLENALHSSIKNFGELHPTTATRRSNLALVYQDLGEYEKAKDLLETALESDIKNFGELHPTTATRRSNLALVYKDLGEYEKAKDLLETALESDIKNFGELHPTIAKIRSNLALVYKDLGEYEKAKDLLETALESSIKNFGELHPTTATSRSNLALVYQDLGEYEKAKDLLETALESSIKNFGELHPTTATSRSNLATVYQDLGEYEKAKDLLETALESSIKNFGELHPTTAKFRSNLALVYQDLGEYEKAKDLLETALESDIKNFGEVHPTTATSRSNLALVYQDLGEYEKAKDLLETALESSIKNFGELHPTTAKRRSNLATVYQDLGEYEKAKDLLETALESDIKNFGELHPTTATRYNNLAYVLFELNDKDKAIQFWISAYKIMKNAMGENHPNTTATKEQLDSVLGKDNWQHML